MAAATTGQASSIFNRVLARVGLSEELAARAMGVSKTRVYRWRRDSTDPASRIEALPVPAREAVVDELARSIGCALVELPPPADVASDICAAGALLREAGEAARVLGEAMADGRFDPHEAAQGRVVLWRLVRVALGLYLRLGIVEENRGDGVRTRGAR